MADVFFPGLERKEYEDFFEQFYEFLETAQKSREELDKNSIPRVQELLNGHLRTFLTELGFGSKDFPDWISDNPGMEGDRSLIMEVVRVSVATMMPLSKSPGSRWQKGFEEYVDELEKFLSVYGKYAFAVSALDMYIDSLYSPVLARHPELFVPECPACFAPVPFNFHEDENLKALAGKYYVNYRAEKSVG